MPAVDEERWNGCAGGLPILLQLVCELMLPPAALSRTINRRALAAGGVMGVKEDGGGATLLRLSALSALARTVVTGSRITS